MGVVEEECRENANVLEHFSGLGGQKGASGFPTLQRCGPEKVPLHCRQAKSSLRGTVLGTHCRVFNILVLLLFNAPPHLQM